uniref:TssA family type VI secretion system protein n=1 Tax=Pantoea sp. IMH TaxID=1267600 RepID=UPI00046825BE|nr:TssA family type VI secretion system protein [Pantoea sp. IMH]
MSTLQSLIVACQADDTQLRQQAQTRTQNWQPWLAPVSDARPTGEDPGYDDDFQRIREEVNKLSGIDTGLICTLAEKLLTTTAKDIRIATYYCWARLHQDGETGFAEGLELLAGLLQRYGVLLHPQRERSRKPALEWLAGSRVLDSLSLWPEVVRDDALRTAGALLLIHDSLESEPEASRPELNALLESRLMKAGGVDAVVPQNAGNKTQTQTPTHMTESDAPVMSRITSGQDLLAQARTLTEYLREQPDGWLAAHLLMKSLRHDTLHSIPAPDAQGKTRIEPPRADQRAMLKRLYLQQSWSEIMEQADSAFSHGANHLWLDLQWYIHQALEKADIDSLDATLHWLQTRPGSDSAKDKWLLRLVMARVAEQKGKNELALHLLGELDSAAQSITLTQWTPALLFEVKSRRLRLLRMKATRNETDKSRLQPEMDLFLSGLIALDPASSAVLC